MKRISILMLACVWLVSAAKAQITSPTPQAVPYAQDFSALAHAATTYPTGMAGWQLSSAASTSFITGGPTADRALIASSSASNNSGGIHNYNGKIGILTSGTANPGIAIALVTTGQYNVTVKYDIMVIRNPYDGATNTRINQSTLQYRIGNVGAWNNLTEAIYSGVPYQSGTTTQTGSGVTTPQNLESRTITLPDATDNQPEVQIRWLVRDVTGSGSRPSFAIDNISIEQDFDGDGFVASLDCNDNNALIYPGAAENCNGVDDDCDALIDEGTFATFYADADSDLFGNPSVTVFACVAPGGYVGNNLDCNDLDNAINPLAAEVCNGLDDECDGLSDDADPDLVGAPIWFADADGDGFGDAATFAFACNMPTGYTADPSDCDDTNASANPAGTEVCNGIDDNCDGVADDGLTFLTYYADADGDSFGDALATISSCAGVPVGYAENSTDCDDAQSAVFPGATELCDGLDNDCDGETDESVVSATVTPAGTAYTCKGVDMVFGANTGEGYTYQWFKNGNVISGATAATYAASKPAYYQVQVNLPAGCFTLSAATLLQVLPNPNANISAPNGTSLCATVKLKASYDATYTYQWMNGGAAIAGATTYQYFPAAAGNYSCTITNVSGCSRTTASIAVSACRAGDGISTSGAENFAMYPNPANDRFVLDMELNTTAEEAQVSITNMLGVRIYAATAGITNGTINQTITLDANIPAGMYIVQVLADGRAYTKQLLIQK